MSTVVIMLAVRDRRCVEVEEGSDGDARREGPDRR
jgi:hypothetical protein